MIEGENSSISSAEYQAAFPNSDPDAKAKAIAAIKMFDDMGKEREIFESATQGMEDPYTKNLLSEVEGKRQEVLITGQVVRSIAYSKSGREIYTNNYFQKGVLDPIRLWQSHPQASEEESLKIDKIQNNLKNSISGVMWAIYNEELKASGFQDSNDFARYLFPGQEVRPNSYNSGLVEDTKRELG
jgi:hypothetical protein